MKLIKPYENGRFNHVEVKRLAGEQVEVDFLVLDEEGNEIEREGVYAIDLQLTDEEKEPFLSQTARRRNRVLK